MAFGFGIGDFIAISNLAWRVYKSCKDAPQTFGQIHVEVLSLHAVLKEAEESVFAQPLSEEQEGRLKLVRDGCNAVLEDLDKLVTKYHSLATQSKRTYDRIRFGQENVPDLRARLLSNIVLLNTWIRQVIWVVESCTLD